MTKNYDSVHVMAAKLGLLPRSDSPGFQPEAMRLAAWLSGAFYKMTAGDALSAANELKRLYTELQNAYTQIESLKHAVSKAQSEAERYANPMVIGQRDALAEVLRELDECAAYWSEYDVPLGIHERIKSALALIPTKPHGL